MYLSFCKTATILKIGIVQSEGVRDVERVPLFYNRVLEL